MRICSRKLGAVLALCLLASAQAGQKAESGSPSYDIVKLPFQPAAINEAGEVAGAVMDENAGTKAVVWSKKSGMRVLGALPGFPNAKASAINDRGDIAGWAGSFTSDHTQAFVVRNGNLRALEGGSRAYAMNRAGDVVGESYSSTERGPTVWRRGTKKVVIPNCCGGAARAINDRGTTAGDIYNRDGRYHAFTWDGKKLTVLPFTEDASSARAINRLGHMVIYTPQGNLLLRGTRSTKLGSPEMSVTGLNDQDQAVGAFGPNPFAPHAFLWDEKRGRTELNKAVPANSGWKLERALGINNHGEIVGVGDYQHEENAGFLLEPKAR